VNLTSIILLCTVAYLPPLIYAVWIRNTERYEREDWRPIVLCFLWGATIAVIAAFILEFLLDISVALSINDENILGLVLVIIVAPCVEEFTKPLALRLKTVKRALDEPEDGFIYGAVAGLGFSATENLLYGFNFLSEGLFIFIVLMAMRSVGGCLLHASATSLTGYGYGRTLMSRATWLNVLPYFLLAIALHGFYNLLVSVDILGVASGLSVALLLVIVTITFIRRKIKNLDEQGTP
jgi:RsiW-degrading membrane proteinase PrsW (M82 family)